jgi:hypothetical protein
MKPISLKVKMQALSDKEKQAIVGGASVAIQLKTVTVVGKAKRASKLF